MATNVKIRSHKTRVIRAMFREISVKAKKDTAYPNMSKSEIGKILRPTTMALLKATLNMLKPCNGGVENDGKMRWRKEVMNHLNMFNSAPRGHVARFRWMRGARVMHAPTGRMRSGGRGERKARG